MKLASTWQAIAAIAIVWLGIAIALNAHDRPAQSPNQWKAAVEQQRAVK